MLEMLGILIGFSSIMLMFSMLVTALVQGVSATINLRAINLKGGLKRFVNRASKLLGEQNTNNEFLNDTLSLMKANLSVLHKRDLGFVSYEDVLAAMEKQHAFKTTISGSTTLAKSLKTQFERIEDEMTERFQTWMNTLSIAITFIVVFTFQLNAFELLKKLSIDEEFRQTIIASQSQKKSLLLADDVKFQHINEVVNHEFVAKYGANTPELKQLLNKEANSKRQALANFYASLETRPEFLKDHYDIYQSMLQAALDSEMKKIEARVKTSFDELAKFNFEPMPNDKKDYSLSNVLGMLFSTILISLGAPFWFKTMRNLIGLRNALSARETKNQT